MSIPSPHYADLADYAYKKKPELNSNGKYDPVTIDGVDYEPLRFVDNKATGYQGVVYQRVDTGEIIVAHRGTEPKDLRDGVADAQMVARAANPQFPNALELTQWAQEYAKDAGKPIEVTVTGHSLGGTLAELTAYHCHLRGETFNAYGAGDLVINGQSLPEGGSQIINHVMATDVVSAATPHFGQVRTYATPAEIQYLTGPGGYEPGSLGPGNLLTTVAGRGAGMHGIHHFSRLPRDDGRPDPYSVLQDPQTFVLAAKHQPAIGQYRGEVATAHREAALGARLGGALGTAAGHVATAQARHQAWAMDAAGDVMRVATNVQGKAVEHGSHVAGQALGGAMRGAGDVAAQGRELRGEVAATVDRLQGAVQERGAQGMADVLRGFATLLPEEQRRQLEKVAGELAHSGEQAHARQRIEAETERRTAHDDAQQWRSRSQSLGDRIETQTRQAGRQAGEGWAEVGRRADEQLDGGGHQLKQRAEQATQAGRVAGEGAVAVGAVLGGAAARQAIDAPTEAVERVRDALKSPAGSQQPHRDAEHAPKVEHGRPQSYLDPAHRDHGLFQRVREGMPAHVSDEKVAELTLAAKRGLVPNGDRILEMGISNDRAYVFGPLGTAGAIVDLRTPAPPMVETIRQAEAMEQQQAAQLAQFQEQQRQSHERGGRAMT